MFFTGVVLDEGVFRASMKDVSRHSLNDERQAKLALPFFLALQL